MSSDPNEELEKFRKQWKDEVTARSKGAPANRPDRAIHPHAPSGTNASTSQTAFVKGHPKYSRSDEFRAAKEENAALESSETRAYHDLEDLDEARRLGIEGEGLHPSIAAAKKPTTALEHYEKAVEREDSGNLGDSVNLYRQAYKLDAGVDKIYRNKYFPPSTSKSKPTNPNPSNASVTVPGTAHHSLDGPPASSPTVSELINSFAGLSIPPRLPETDASPQPPCPISKIPSELLVDILYRLAIADIASFARTSLVCKHFAHLIATEDRIWERVCLGSEYGFGSMHYDWASCISGAPLPQALSDFMPPDLTSSSDPSSLPDLFALRLEDPSPSFISTPTHPVFPLCPIYPTHRTMFRNRPRIRFNGCYISTVNYIRPGASMPSQISWNTPPVHIVTYYRYLRFFRDGSCVSLLTTQEPIDVVHHLSKSNLPNSDGTTKGAHSIPPMSIMQHALRGRWKLSPPSEEDTEEPEGTLTIETLGIDPEKYTYVLSLSLKSAGRNTGVRNNKLGWRGFWSYNKLTDDWAEFGLKNDKPFFWSRVGSYGMGE